MLALTAAGAAQSGAAATEKTAGETFKNIQVLKDIPASQLFPTMQYITVALGVRCNFCHVEGHFDQDTKPHKVTARHMMEMVFAVNKSTFNGRPQVSCYTCHRGASHPEGMPPIREATAMAAPVAAPAAEPPAASLPTADEITTKYLAALGGADALQAIKSLAAKGTLETPRGSVPVEIDRKAPDKELVVFHAPNGTRLQGFNGTVAWEQEGSDAARTQSGAAAEQAKRQAEMFPALSLKSDYPQMRVLGVEKVNGQEAYRVAARREGGGFVLMDFDTQSGLLLRVETFRRTPLGALPEATEYSDYRDVQGVKIPFTVRMAGAENGRTFQFDTITPNVAIDDAHFEVPAASAAQ